MSYAICTTAFLLLAVFATAAHADKVLLTVDKSTDISRFTAVGNSTIKLTSDGNAAAIHVTVPRGIQTAGVAIPAPDGKWDLSENTYVMADVRNVGQHPMKVRCRVDNPGVDANAKTDFGIHPTGNFVNGDVMLAPGQSATVQAELRRRKPDWIKVDLFGMVTYPWGQCQSSDPAKSAGTVDASNIASIFLHVKNPFADAAFEISGIRAVGKYKEPAAILKDPEKFFPFVDEFGQYIHEDWPGKTHALGDFEKNRAAETSDLAAHPAPDHWDKYGGWNGGPKLKSTGYFYTAKYNGKWWLVDPEGNLFFSNGMDTVNSREGATTIDDREKWFARLPAKDSEFKECYAPSRAFPRGYYAGRSTTNFDFTKSNLIRKYGPNWKTTFADLAHQRLRSWGFNTIANWGDPDIYSQKKTPYTVNVSFRSKPLEAAEGWWGKSPDSFDEDFKTQLRKAMAQQAETSAKDAWCIGYFVGNEMEWGANDTDLAKMTLASPPEQAGKKVFIADLKAKYTTIDKLNAAWGTSHESWDALLNSKTPPTHEGAHADLVAFTAKTCDNYFATVRAILKETAPDHLYLGCRFAGGLEAPAVMGAAAKSCDIVSVNLYRRNLTGFALTVDADVPLLVGEFSFWGTDRGKFNRGGLSMEALDTQAERADCYKEFVQSALRHPQFVGCHYFKYMDQPTTGRGDGENFQFGFLDVCDTPYPETITAARLLAKSLYESRASNR